MNDPDLNSSRPEQPEFESTAPFDLFRAFIHFPHIPKRIFVWGWVIALMIGAGLEVWYYVHQELPDNWGVGLIPAGIMLYVVLLSFAGQTLKRVSRIRFATEWASVQAVRKSEQLQEGLDDNFFTNLVKINFKYIDQYYLQTQLQANKSFSLCLTSSIVGLTVVVVGILLLFWNHGSLQAGYVATASGTLSEFIAAVFFYLYNQTITKMGQYHQKLVLTQNISLALKIAEELPAAEQVAARMSLIGYLSADINKYLTMPIGSPEVSSKKDRRT
jgi:hypothetical protein